MERRRVRELLLRWRSQTNYTPEEPNFTWRERLYEWHNICQRDCESNAVLLRCRDASASVNANANANTNAKLGWALEDKF